jgi:dTDP-4-dehydrorhamnose reductase
VTRRKRVLVTGADGCVGSAVRARGRARGLDLVCLGHADLDVTDAVARERALDLHRPDAVLFCAAFTAVDACAGDPASARVNVEAPGAWARRVETWWLSSNFVFHTRGPHAPDAVPTPRGVYANQKIAAETAVRAAGGHVARVGWVYGPGGRTFASTLARRLRAGEQVAAIADVVVQPTWSEDLADALLDLPEGVTHHIGAGETSWYGLALAVQARVGSGVVVPVRQEDLHLTDPRPRDARLTPARLAPWWDRLALTARL